MKQKSVKTDGIVKNVLPNATFKVELEKGEDHIVDAYLSGKMRMHRIKVVEGDKVKLELSPTDLTTGRITYRY